MQAQDVGNCVDAGKNYEQNRSANHEIFCSDGTTLQRSRLGRTMPLSGSQALKLLD
jgi:hypothetical protein